MAELKTKPTQVSVEAFLDGVEPASKREDGKVLDALFRKVTGEAPRMWGPTIVGYGEYHYRYASGHEGDTCLTGFSPRSGALVIYLGPGLENDKLMAKLGKHKRGKGCLYINKLDDVDRGVLRKLVQHSIAEMRKRA